MTNEILKTFLEANSLKELTNAAGRALGCPLLVIDDSFHVAAYFRADSINDPYSGVIRHGELSYDESALISASAASASCCIRLRGTITGYPSSTAESFAWAIRCV